MTALPHMPMYWERFFADTEKLPADTQGFYALLLGKMWINQGWLPGDDGFIARLLRIDIRTWRSRHKAAILALLQAEIDPVLGPIYRQKRLVAELAKAADLIKKRQAQTAPATAERLRKSGKGPHVTLAVDNSRNVDRNVDRNEVRHARAEPEPEEPTSQGDVGSGSPLPPPPTPVAHSLGHEGRSLASRPSAELLSGPYVPAERPARRNDWDQAPAPGPKAQTRFLQAYAAAGGDFSKLPVKQGAPAQPILPKDGLGIWDSTHRHYDPKPETPEQAAKRLLDMRKGEREAIKPKEDKHGPDDDEIRDFLKF